MKKLLLISLLSLSYVGCCKKNPISYSISKEKIMYLKASYNFSLFEFGHTGVMYNDNYLSFNLRDYNISNVIAGDILTINYCGESLVEESYPGRIVFDKINTVSHYKTEVIELNVTINELGEINLISNENYLIYEYPEYIKTNDDNKYLITDDYLSEGMIVYASKNEVIKSNCKGLEIEIFNINTLYSYNPRIEKDT